MADKRDFSKSSRNCIDKSPNLDRGVQPELTEEDLRYEMSLRPRSMNEYIGQEEVKNNLQVFIEAAKNRGEALYYGFRASGECKSYIWSGD